MKLCINLAKDRIILGVGQVIPKFLPWFDFGLSLESVVWGWIADSREWRKSLASLRMSWGNLDLCSLLLYLFSHKIIGLAWCWSHTHLFNSQERCLRVTRTEYYFILFAVLCPAPGNTISTWKEFCNLCLLVRYVFVTTFGVSWWGFEPLSMGLEHWKECFQNPSWMRWPVFFYCWKTTSLSGPFVSHLFKSGFVWIMRIFRRMFTSVMHF